MTGHDVLGPAVAGTWYAAGRDALARQVDELLEDSPAPPADPLRALVAPHAGFVYSGAVAARGFAALRGTSWRRVLLLGPSHYLAFSGAAVPRARAYRTPLGEVEIDAAGVDAVLASSRAAPRDDAFEPEHSLEAELPFLQRVLEPGWTAVPVLLGGSSDGAALRAVAEACRAVLDEGTLVVASSDFTHFGRRFGYVPFRDRVPERIEALDRQAIAPIVGGDVEGFASVLDRTGATLCGRHAIEVALHLLGAGARGRLLAYDTSGRMTGDWEHSVSYASIALMASPA